MNTELVTVMASVAVAAGLTNILTLLVLRRSGRQPSGRRVVLDTCALIDGRIVDIARAGFVPNQLLIPRSVVRELQFLADQADPLRRERARFGLDIIRELQQMKEMDVRIISRDTDKLVDEQLIALSKQYGAQLYTTDYNLNKVAQVEGVNVLNVNELAQMLRARFLPGEKADVKLVQAGQGAGQAVGYLDDGTMVVVEHAQRYIGKQVEVTFVKSLQTQAGKMMFAEMREGPSSGSDKRSKRDIVVVGQKNKRR